MVKVTSFLTALLTGVLSKSLVSINVHNRSMLERDGERERQKRGKAREEEYIRVL